MPPRGRRAGATPLGAMLLGANSLGATGADGSRVPGNQFDSVSVSAPPASEPLALPDSASWPVAPDAR